MLSWSSSYDGYEPDIAALVDDDHESIGVPLADELTTFASAFAHAAADDGALAEARRRLVDRAGEAFMVDAAAVAANFEMMTRVADGSGARFADGVDAVDVSRSWTSSRH
jgi:hypothetical protein